MALKLVFSWDSVKAEINRKKHGISFEEAVTVFDDPDQVSHMDRIENGEERWQTIGRMADLCVLLVAHTTVGAEADGGYVEYVRIISARKADKKERGIYGRGYF